MRTSTSTVVGSAMSLLLVTSPAAAAAPNSALPIRDTAVQRAAPGADGPGDQQGPQTRVTGDVTIKRDTYGVPHVYSETVEGLYTGYGYAVAQDRMYQMEMAKRSVLGTSAEVIGPEGIENDQRSRATLDPASIQAQIEQLPEEERAVLRGYAAGYNQYVDIALAHPHVLLPKQFHDAGFQPSHFTEYDVAMIWIGTMANRFSDFTGEVENLKVREQLVAQHGEQKGRDLFDQLVWMEDPTAPTTVPRSQTPEQLSRAETASRSPLRSVSPDLPDSDAAQASAFGGAAWPHAAPEASNLWAVGAEKSASGGSTLLNGPQFDWFNPSYVYGIGLHGAGIDVTGNTPFGYPSIIFGTNKDISWGATAGPLDVNDIYQEQLNPEDPSQYMFNGEYRPMDVRTETIKVKGAEDVQTTVRSTVHGTVTAMDEQNNTAYSKKRAWKGTEVQSLMAWVNIMKAKSWDEYLEEAEKVGITINWYYADKEGNIGYVSPGKLPNRPENQDFRVPAIGDGSMEWDGFRPFSDNPRTYNPDQGYIANWNNQSGPGFNSDSGNWSSVDRVNEITSRLEAHDTLTPQQMWDINRETSFVDVNLRYLRDPLRDATAGSPESDSAQLLLGWDGATRDDNADGFYDGPGPTIMRTWLPILSERVLADDLPAEVYQKYAESIYSEPGGSVRPAESMKLLVNALERPNAPVTQHVDFFNGEDQNGVLRETFQQTLDQLRAEYGADPNQWLTPVTPHTYKTRNFMGIPQADPSEEITTHQYMNRGTENNLVHLQPHGAGMCVAAPPGQSGFISPSGVESPHYRDQLELYTQFDCKPENLYPHQVEANLESVTRVR